MANVKITGLDALAEAPNGADLVEIVDDVAGTPTSKKITIANLMANTVSSYNDTGVTLTNTTTENTISVDQNGNVGTDVATDGAVHIENTGNTGIGLGVYSNIGATADAELVSILADNPAFDKPALKVRQDGIDCAIEIDMNGTTPSVQDKAALFIENTPNNGIAFAIYSNNDADQVNPLVQIKADNALFDKEVVSIINDGTAAALFLDQNSSGVVFDIDQDSNDANPVYGIRMNLANAGAGLEYAFRFNGSEIVSAAVGGSQDKKIQISIAATNYYIPCYTA